MNKESVSLWADIKKYEDMLGADPKSYCFTLLSELYRKLGLLDDAISIARRGIEIHPEYIGGYAAIGRAYFEKGMKEESISALERVVHVTPENILAQKLLSQMYIERGDLESAIRSLEVIGLLNPEDVESSLMLEALKKTAARDGERVDFEPAAASALVEEVTADSGEVIFDVGMAESGLSEEFGESSIELSDAEEFTEQIPLATATMAELYVSQGFLDRAINVYRELLGKEPGNDRFAERLKELERIGTGSDDDSDMMPSDLTDIVSRVGVDESPAGNSGEKPVFGYNTGNSEEVVYLLECWLENIRRGKTWR